MTAIRNGKNDVRDGKAFPQPEKLNNGDGNNLNNSEEKVLNTSVVPADLNGGILSAIKGDLEKDPIPRKFASLIVHYLSVSLYQ